MATNVTEPFPGGLVREWRPHPSQGMPIDLTYDEFLRKYWTAGVGQESLAGGDESEGLMRLVDTFKNRTRALKVREVADLLGVTPQQIYKMAAQGRIPSFRISGSVRFDPHDLAGWVNERQSSMAGGNAVQRRSAA